ncbi:TMEM175 family protein [Lactiplantibacillus plantarum]|uniref:TMEM175 family protein n=1 Tax=Lactiplantibacillus plantarum TaxID=1590 RepID=UPI002011113C|nr:TMEM175 family protein [Lactiplantibacillus plantarum]
MNKGRVEAFTDAVVAIVMTIMVLEFEVPSEPTFAAFAENGSYFIAYLISFLFIGVAWYNHHYMLTLTKRISKRVYWLNNL